MTQLTRRKLFAGAAAATAGSALAPLVGSPARAAAPMAGKQAPGIYRYKLGDFEIMSIHDGVHTFPVGPQSVKNAPIELVTAVIESNYMPKDTLIQSYNPMLVNTGSKLVLMDTGNGAGRYPNAGFTMATLAAAGVDPKLVDIIVISHFHADHINGILAADGSLAYPNAEIKVPAGEWAYWMDDGNMSRAGAGKSVGGKFCELSPRIVTDCRQADQIRSR